MKKKTLLELFDEVQENCSAGAVGAGAISGGLAIGTTEAPKVKIIKRSPKTKKRDNNTISTEK